MFVGKRWAHAIGMSFVMALLIDLPVAEAQENARVTKNAYIYVEPDRTRQPFAMLEADSLVTILGVDGDWFNISILDTAGRTQKGYVSRQAVQRLPPTLKSRNSEAPADSSRAKTPPVAAGTLPTVSSSSAPFTPADQPAPADGVGTRRAPTRVQDVRRIFIAPIPNDLDQYISAEITKQFQGRVVVVLKKESADAILRGASESKTGVGAAITGRYLGLHDNASASISLVDPDETEVLWASEAGDRSLMWGVMARGGQRKVAARLVGNLKKVLMGK